MKFVSLRDALLKSNLKAKAADEAVPHSKRRRQMKATFNNLEQSGAQRR